jgi:hypothetical protein
MYQKLIYIYAQGFLLLWVEDVGSNPVGLSIVFFIGLLFVLVSDNDWIVDYHCLSFLFIIIQLR